MNKLKKTFILLLSVCTATCAAAGFAACDKSGNYPDFKNPADIVTPPGGDGDTTGRYTLNIRSAGGLALDGVQASFKKNGTTVVNGISKEGKIVVGLEPDEYTIEIDEATLPAGYYIPEGQEYKTSSDTNEITISTPSKVISTTAPSNISYALGDVMYDFSYTAGDGEKYLLSELVEKYKAVMLNFWYISCGPCQTEFPAIQKAYESFSDKLAIVALNAQDSATAIKNFQTEKGYTFHMAYDSSALQSRFGVTGWPTTVIVDRYGVIAYRSQGMEASSGAWQSLFAKYTSDSYTQIIKPDDGNNDEYENVKPAKDAVYPESAAIAQAINGSGADGKVTKYYPEQSEKDAEYNWPWSIEKGSDFSYLSATNVGTEPTYAIMYCDLSLKSGDMVSYDYNIKTAAGYDTIYVILNGRTLLAEHSGDSNGWQSQQRIYTATRDIDITLSFTYRKLKDSNKQDVENEFAAIKNLRVENIESSSQATDVEREAYYDGITMDMLELKDDGYYYIRNSGSECDGALLLIDLWGDTAWSYLHTGSYTFEPEGSGLGAYATSMYYISFWELSNYATAAENEITTYNYTKHSRYLNLMLNLQLFSENGYVPVTQTLRGILEEFCLAFNDNKMCTEESTKDSWLEMCYYFQHHNGEHEGCYKFTDPVKGMGIFNPIVANEGKNHVNIKSISIHEGGGLYYSFTAPESGVYKINSVSDKIDVDPGLFIVQKDESGIYTDLTKYIEFEDDLSYDGLANTNLRDFKGYVYVEKGETVYLQMHLFAQSTGEFDFFIEYVGESYDWLRVCTTAGGMFIAYETGTVYGAVPWAYSDFYKCYYVPSDDEEINKIYIDFVHPNYFDINDHTLYQLIVDFNYFDMSDYGAGDYTSVMLEYYYKSIEGKDEDDELYGMLEADKDLVEIIAYALQNRGLDGDGYETGYWLSLACYYQHFGK